MNLTDIWPGGNFTADAEELTFDYMHQAWVKDGLYVRCGHPETMDCRCYGKMHEGEHAPTSNEEIAAELEGFF